MTPGKLVDAKPNAIANDNETNCKKQESLSEAQSLALKSSSNADHCGVKLNIQRSTAETDRRDDSTQKGKGAAITIANPRQCKKCIALNRDLTKPYIVPPGVDEDEYVNYFERATGFQKLDFKTFEIFRPKHKFT